MSRSFKPSPPPPREVIPAGSYPARCIAIIEIGTVAESFNGTPREAKRLRLGFELPTEADPFSDSDQPMVMWKKYTNSIGTKANLRKDIVSWFGKDFKTQDDANNFELLTLLGRTCQVNITHATDKNDSSIMYANIGSIIPLAKGQVCPEQVIPLNSLLYSDFDWNYFNSLPEFIQKEIKSSQEFVQLGAPGTQSKPAEAPANIPPSPADDLPF